MLDTWFEQAVKPRLEGRAFLVRYADDVVRGFAWEGAARRVLEVLPKFPKGTPSARPSHGSIPSRTAGSTGVVAL